MADSQINVRIVGSSSGAEQALDRVAKKAENALGKDVTASMEAVKSKAQKIFGIEIPSIMNAAKSGAAFGAAAIGIEAAGRAMKDMAVSAVQTTDQLTQIRARINLINDGSQSTAEIMDKIYSAANRSRGSYLDMADSVAKLNMLAKDAFSSNDEAIYFVEQLNKQFKISGASVEETTSAMYQLTQAMAAGKLQGDEFHSIMENAPMLAQSIASEMGLTVGQLKEMSSQGLITADIIKEALFNSAEETNAKFAEIPMTFQDIGTQVQNELIAAFQPAMEEISNMTSSGVLNDALAGLSIAFRLVGTAAQAAIITVRGAFSALSVVIGTAKNIVTSFANLFRTAMPGVATAIVGVTTAFITYKATVALCSTQTAALTVKTVALKTAQVASAIATRAYALAMTVVKVAIQGTILSIGALTLGTTVLKSLFLALRSSTLAAATAQRVLNVVMKANPVGILISVIMTLVGVFATASAASNGFGNTLSSVFSTIVHTAVWGVNKIIEGLNWLIAKLNSVGDKVAKFFGTSFTAIQQVDTISAETAQDIVNTGVNMASQITQGLSGGGDTGLDVGGGGGDDGGSAGTGKGGKGGGGGKGHSGKDLAKEAKEVHEKILQSFLEMQGNQVELIELQYKKELDELNKSKSANVNYQEDLKNLNDVYADKRIKAKQEEFTKLRAIETGIRDMQQDFAFKTSSKDSTGSVSPAVQLATDYANAIDEVEDRYAEMVDKFMKMDKMEQQHHIDLLKQRGVEFEMSADGQISYEKMKNEELLAAQDEYAKKALQQHTDLVNEKYAIDEAMRTQNFEALQAALTDEYIAEQQHYDLKKQLLEEWKEAVFDAHWNGQQVMFDAAQAGLDSFQNSISGLIQGTTTLMQTFQNLGKAILKTIADSVAQWIAGQIKQAVFGKMLAAQQAATGTAAANAQYPAWAALAQQVSMATGGASAIAGMAAWSANTAAGAAQTATQSAFSGMFNSGSSGFSSNLSLPKLASGGVAYGSTYAEIGEGKYKEAVLPLSESTYDEIGGGIARANGGGAGSITFNVSAMDAQSFGTWLENSAGRSLRQFLVNQDREFIATEGTW
ncbi:tape measure domain-containing protein [Veillonella sp. ICM51a]|uniref:tape measure protein n=1 Tax=Veillonella sp. ICM51a TaxID=936591 RepID=UPI0004B8DA64|nr:tape measure domain-containing protein [Veillonella sp. ICM51a]